MASLTFTFSQLQSEVVQRHVGIVAAGGAYSWAVTMSPSSVMALCRVPDGATIVDFWMRYSSGAAAQTLELGTSQTPSGIMSLTTLSSTYSLSVGTAELVSIYGNNDRGVIDARSGGTRGNRGAITDLLPVRISLSDDYQPNWVWVQGRGTTSISATAFATFMLFSTSDGLTGHPTIR